MKFAEITRRAINTYLNIINYYAILLDGCVCRAPSKLILFKLTPRMENVLLMILLHHRNLNRLRSTRPFLESMSFLQRNKCINYYYA